MRYLNFVGYLAIPFAYLVHYWIGRDAKWEPTVTFILAALGVVPLAHLMGEATEHLADRTGPTWGGLLNATFGNAAELIIGIIALSKGLNSLVIASLTGSILGNLLLVSGFAMLVGGWNREKKTFSRATAETNAGMLVMAVAAMLFPAIFHLTYERAGDQHLREHALSLGASLILLAVYGCGLLFTLRTHAHLFTPAPATSPEDPIGIAALGYSSWSTRRSVIVLLVASIGVAFVAELLVGSAETMAEHLHWNRVFVGVLNMNGQTNWFEGVLLLALYAILGIVFFYIPMGEAGQIR